MEKKQLSAHIGRFGKAFFETQGRIRMSDVTTYFQKIFPDLTVEEIKEAALDAIPVENGKPLAFPVTRGNDIELISRMHIEPGADEDEAIAFLDRRIEALSGQLSHQDAAGEAAAPETGQHSGRKAVEFVDTPQGRIPAYMTKLAENGESVLDPEYYLREGFNRDVPASAVQEADAGDDGVLRGDDHDAYAALLGESSTD